MSASIARSEVDGAFSKAAYLIYFDKEEAANWGGLFVTSKPRPFDL
jgi:hypothetical protein